MATLLDGRTLALNLRKNLHIAVAELAQPPKLGVILVGDDPASHLYVSLKIKAAQEVGIIVEKKLLPAATAAVEIEKQILEFNRRPDIHGILIQLPLPQHLNEHQIISMIDPTTDADGFHPDNLKKIGSEKKAIIPGVSNGIMKLIAVSGQSLAQKKALLIVNSQEFAWPLEKLLTQQGAQVNISQKIDSNETLAANIIVIAIGQANSLHANQVTDGAVIIDVGTNNLDGRVVGDVAASEFTNKNVWLSPVPGGVGPMTVVMLLWNVYELARRTKE